MKNKILAESWDFFKINFKFLLLGGLFLILYFQGCFDRFAVTQKPTRDTVTTTTQVPQPIVIMPQYTPTQSGSTVIPVSIPSQYDASKDIAKLTEQYNDLVKKYLSIKTYRDSIELKDTSGKKVGVVDLTQVVSENELKSTQPTYQLNFPHTTTTITVKEPYIPRNQVFIGGGVGSTINNNVINTMEGGIFLKNKKENMIGFGATYDFVTNKPGMKISFYKKISFKPKIGTVL